MSVEESCGSDYQPALHPGECSVAAKLSSTLPMRWDYLIPDATFQDRLYMGICRVINVLTEFDI